MIRTRKAASLNKKRSAVIGERKTSLTLEDDFWLSLKEIAALASSYPIDCSYRYEAPARQLVVGNSSIRAGLLSPARRRGRAGRQGETVMHKFYIGQAVVYNPPHGTFVPSGTWHVTEKLPERNGECYYRIHHAIEQHERIAREGELTAIAIDTKAPGPKAKRP
jgi:hypothetical protein